MRSLIAFLMGLSLVAVAFASSGALFLLPADNDAHIGPIAQDPTVDDMWDLVFFFNAQQATGDYQLLGGEYAFDKFYITGGNSGGEPNQVYVFDSEGNLLFQFDQWSSAGWGWRDLAFDGNYLYGSGDLVIHAFDENGNPVPGMNIPMSAATALAYDEVTDHFWAQAGGLLVEFDRNGNIIWSGSSGVSAYGAAFDNAAPDGPWLWLFSQTGSPQTTFHQFDPINHLTTGFIYQLPLLPGSTDQVAAGAFFTEEWDPECWILGGITQGTPDDMLFCLEMYPNVIDTFDVTIDLTNYTPNPWAYLNFDVQVTNHETFTVTFDAWLVVTLPTGVEITVIQRELNLMAGQSAMRNLTLTIPPNPLPGTYTMTGYTGDYPDAVWDSDFFNFDILGDGDGIVDPASWSVSGWDDPSETALKTVVPGEFTLPGNNPNPFNPTTVISYQLPVASFVKLEVFDVSGRRVGAHGGAPLVDSWRDAGVHEATFDASGLAAGVYIYRLTGGGKSTSAKMVLMK